MENIFKPILYSPSMVHRILEDKKGQTRRTKGLEVVNEDWRAWNFVDFGTNPNNENDNRKHACFRCFVDTWLSILCPYQIGNILWVRENLYQNGELGLEYFADKNAIDEGIIPFDYGPYGGSYSFRTIPNIHMPKWACRIFLKVKSINLERLQDISEEDAIAEGAIQYESDTDWLTAKYGFQIIWETINGSDSWNKNPFVWVIEFERIEKPLDFI